MRNATPLPIALAIAAALLALPARAQDAAASPPASPALVQMAPIPEEAAGSAGRLDVEAATRAYLAEVPGPARERSDAYVEGGYWLLLWGFLWGAGVSLLLLFTGWSAAMRDRAERWTRRPSLRAAAYALQYLVATALLSLPWAAYADFLREHAYGLSNLSFGAWLGEEGKGLILTVAMGAPVLALAYRVVARAPRTWWLWGGAASLGLIAAFALLFPVLVAPVFNHPQKLGDDRVAAPILSLARANGLEAGAVWETDASKQTRRISANVSGFLGTERITLNDNLLARASLPEIEAVMAHEIAHYVLNHIYKKILQLGVVILAALGFVQLLFERLRRRFERRWRVRGIDDPAGLPLAALLFSAFALLATPLTNSITRVAEQEADWYGLNAARQPDGFARIALKLGEYRKLEPGPLEELLFFDHPSGRTRIRTAMRWKAEHPETWGPGGGETVPAGAPGP